MPDIFDEVTSPKKDIFDEVAPTPKDILKDNHSIGSYALETMQNVPRSAANLIGGSAKTVGKVASTGYNLLTDPYKTLSETGPIDAKQGLYNSFNYFKDRYSHPLDTLMEDPVGVAADVSTFASGAGLGARMLRMAPEASTALRGVGTLTDPLQGASRLAGAVSKVPRQAAAEGLYGKSLGRIPRDPKGLPLMEKSDLVKEGLNSQIPMSEKGAYLANDRIKDLASEVDNLAKQLENSGAKVNMHNVLGELKRSLDEFGHVAPQEDRAAIRKVARDFVEQYGTPSVYEFKVPGSTQGIPDSLKSQAGKQTISPEYWWMDMPDEPKQVGPAHALPKFDKSTPGVEVTEEPKRLESGRNLPPGNSNNPPKLLGTGEPGTIYDPYGRETQKTIRVEGPNVPGDMSPVLSNEVKRRTYQNVGNSAYTSKQSSATVEAMVDLARGLKKELERLDNARGPNAMQNLNERQGNLIDLRKIAGGEQGPDLGGAAASSLAGYHNGLLRQALRGVPYAESQAALSIAPGPPIAGPVRSVARAIGKGLTPAGTVGKAMSYSTKDPYQIEVVK